MYIINNLRSFVSYNRKEKSQQRSYDILSSSKCSNIGKYNSMLGTNMNSMVLRSTYPTLHPAEKAHRLAVKLHIAENLGKGNPYYIGKMMKNYFGADTLALDIFRDRPPQGIGIAVDDTTSSAHLVLPHHVLSSSQPSSSQPIGLGVGLPKKKESVDLAIFFMPLMLMSFVYVSSFSSTELQNILSNMGFDPMLEIRVEERSDITNLVQESSSSEQDEKEDAQLVRLMAVVVGSIAIGTLAALIYSK